MLLGGTSPADAEFSYQLMRARELTHPVSALSSSAISKERRQVLIRWMNEVTTGYRLTAATCDTSVGLLDRFAAASADEIPPHQLQLLACACMLVAAKMEERDEQVPSLQVLNSATASAYSDQLLRNMELVVLHRLRWDTLVVTPRHFSSYFLYRLPADSGDLLPSSHRLVEDAAATAAIADSVSQLLTDFQLCAEWSHFAPSLVAAAAIYLARQLAHISPVWAEAYVALTNYTSGALSSCVALMLQAAELADRESQQT